MADDVWYYHHAGARSGPVAWEDLRAAADRGDLAPGDLVWSPTMSGWSPARVVPGLVSRPEIVEELPPRADTLPGVAPPTQRAPRRTPRLVAVERLFVGRRWTAAVASAVDRSTAVAGSVAYPAAGLLAAAFLVAVGIRVGDRRAAARRRAAEHRRGRA